MSLCISFLLGCRFLLGLLPPLELCELPLNAGFCLFNLGLDDILFFWTQLPWLVELCWSAARPGQTRESLGTSLGSVLVWRKCAWASMLEWRIRI